MTIYGLTPLAVTSLTVVQSGHQGGVVAVANLPAAVHHYDWYEGGLYAESTVAPTLGRAVESGEEVTVDCVPRRYDDVEGRDKGPEYHAERRTIEWIRSLSADVSHYRIEHGTGSGAPSTWTEIGRVPHTGAWSYSFSTPRLADLTYHWFRVIPVGLAGNDGTALTLPREYVVRQPDTIDFSVAFDDGTQRATFAAA